RPLLGDPDQRVPHAGRRPARGVRDHAGPEGPASRAGPPALRRATPAGAPVSHLAGGGFCSFSSDVFDWPKSRWHPPKVGITYAAQFLPTAGIRCRTGAVSPYRRHAHIRERGERGGTAVE